MILVYDISPVISERTGVFPGDVAFRRSVHLDFAKGDHLLLSSIESTLHLAAHADAPSHYTPSGVAISERDVRLYMGDCLVLAAKGHHPGERIGMKHVNVSWRSKLRWRAPRVLVRTDSFPNPEKWNSDFCSLEPSLIENLAQGGVKLIGIDTPSIDPESCQELSAHKQISRFDLAVLEGLDLHSVSEGLYTLIALPLKVEAGDAAPVRAVLVGKTGILEF